MRYDLFVHKKWLNAGHLIKWLNSGHMIKNDWMLGMHMTMKNANEVLFEYFEIQ